MAGKADYKKLGAAWGRKERKHEDLRSKTDKTALENASDSKPRHKKKSRKKKVARSDHKHLYKELVLVKTITSYGNPYFRIRKRCTVCGKIKDEKLNSPLNKMTEETKVVFENGIELIRYLTEEEIVARYGNLPVVIRDESTM